MTKKFWCALLAFVLVCVGTVTIGGRHGAEQVTASAGGFPSRALENYLNADMPAWTYVSKLDAMAREGIDFEQATKMSLSMKWLTGETALKRLRKYNVSALESAAVADAMTRLQVVEDLLSSNRVFPLPATSNYVYENSWGAPRTYGGDRQHLGVDIIVDKGTPVLSMSAGVITKKGWDEKGGWRIGVTDVNGIYHYYAHMSAYAEPIEIGDYVQPGQVLGYVGSTGYGPEGTDNVMIPHLHVGYYDYNDVAFNPYAFLLFQDPKS